MKDAIYGISLLTTHATVLSEIYLPLFQERNAPSLSKIPNFFFISFFARIYACFIRTVRETAPSLSGDKLCVFEHNLCSLFSPHPSEERVGCTNLYYIQCDLVCYKLFSAPKTCPRPTVQFRTPTLLVRSN